jgi:hypothetical protein
LLHQRWELAGWLGRGICQNDPERMLWT